MGQSFLTLGSEREPHPPRAEWFDILIFLVFQLPSLVWTFHHCATWKLQTLSLSREGAEPGDIDRHHIPRRRRTFQSSDSSMCRPVEPKVHSSECSPPAYAHLSCVMAVLVMISGGRRNCFFQSRLSQDWVPKPGGSSRTLCRTHGSPPGRGSSGTDTAHHFSEPPSTVGSAPLKKGPLLILHPSQSSMTSVVFWVTILQRQ